MTINWKEKNTGLEAKFPRRPILHRLHPEPEDKAAALAEIVKDKHTCRRILKKAKPDPGQVRTGNEMLFDDRYAGKVRCIACDSVLNDLFAEKGNWQLFHCHNEHCGLVNGVNRIEGGVAAKNEFQELLKYHETEESE